MLRITHLTKGKVYGRTKLKKIITKNFKLKMLEIYIITLFAHMYVSCSWPNGWTEWAKFVKGIKQKNMRIFSRCLEIAIANSPAPNKQKQKRGREAPSNLINV